MSYDRSAADGSAVRSVIHAMTPCGQVPEIQATFFPVPDDIAGPGSGQWPEVW